MAVRTWPSALEESNVTSQTKETDSRILIDEQLRVAVWNLADKSQVLTKVRVTAETFAAKPSSPLLRSIHPMATRCQRGTPITSYLISAVTLWQSSKQRSRQFNATPRSNQTLLAV